MEHGEALAAISTQLGEPLDPELDDALANHLRDCQACRSEASAWQRTWTALERVPDETLSPRAAARIVPQLRAATLTRKTRLRRQRVLRAATLGGGLALAAAAVALFVAPRGPRLPPAPRLAAETETKLETKAETETKAAAVDRVAALVVDVNSTDGGRARAIALANATLDRGAVDPPGPIVDALIRTMRSDGNPGVRLRAAEALARLFPTVQIKAAFIRALERDDNPAVRIVAVEALGRAAQSFDRESIEALRERAQDQSESTHVRTRVARALQTIEL